jgi:hypothetical protein
MKLNLWIYPECTPKPVAVRTGASAPEPTKPERDNVNGDLYLTKVKLLLLEVLRRERAAGLDLFRRNLKT